MKTFIAFASHRRMMLRGYFFGRRDKTKQEIKLNVIADLIAYLKIRGKK